MLLAFGFIYGMIKVCWTNISADNERARVKKELLARWNAASPAEKANIRAEMMRVFEQSRDK